MDNINNVQGVHYAASVGKNSKTVESQSVSSPTKQKENGDKKLLLALVGLAATGSALIYAAKKGKLQGAIDALKDKFPKSAPKTEELGQDLVTSGKGKNKFTEALGDALSSEKGKKEFTATAGDALTQTKKTLMPYEDGFVGPLPKFDGNNVKQGTFIDGSGHRVTVDRNGTGIIEDGDGTFWVSNGFSQSRYYGSNYKNASIKPSMNPKQANTVKQAATDATEVVQDISQKTTAKTAEAAAENVKNNVNKTIIDSNGDEIIIDKYGTGILNRKNGAYQVTHGSEQVTYDSSDIAVKSKKAVKDNILTRAQINQKKAEKLLKEFEANPNDKKIYKQIAKLTHPDQFGDATIKASKEELSVLNDLFVKASKINKTANRPIQQYA